MIFGTYLGWVGAPTRRKKNSPHVHPKGTCRNFCRKWPKFGQILLLDTQNQPLECAWCVHILHPYFGARYYGVRPKKLSKKFDHTLTQKKVAQAILKFASVGQFPLGFLKGSFLGYFHPWTGWPIFDKAYLYGHGELTNDIWHRYRVGGCPHALKKNLSKCSPKTHPPPNVKIGRISCFGTRKWGTWVCLLGAYHVGPFCGTNRLYQKYIIFQSQLLTPKTRFSRSIPRIGAENVTNFFQNI